MQIYIIIDQGATVVYGRRLAPKGQTPFGAMAGNYFSTHAIHALSGLVSDNYTSLLTTIRLPH